jgi:nucleotide-binding universal stress UspA family protein
MSLAALLVHCDADCGNRLRLASDLAARLHAALIGTAGWLSRPAYALDDLAAEDDSTEQEQQEMTDLLAKMEQAFREAAKSVPHVEWRGSLDYPSELVPREARAADLVIVGHPKDPSDLFYSLNPGAAILRAGRPVLVVPDAIDSLQARRIVVAWKDTREARRAIADALPFLREAERVTIVAVSELGAEGHIRKEIDDVTSYLLRHKVTVGAKAYLHTKQPIAAELIRFSKDEKADLIVAGGYGHSRLGEWMFGGVTNGLLTDSPTCCLFSH